MTDALMYTDTNGDAHVVGIMSDNAEDIKYGNSNVKDALDGHTTKLNSLVTNDITLSGGNLTLSQVLGNNIDVYHAHSSSNNNAVDIVFLQDLAYTGHTGLLLTRYSVFAIVIQVDGNSTITCSCEKILSINNETLTLTPDNTNRLITVKSNQQWNCWGIFSLCNQANNYIINYQHLKLDNLRLIT